MIRVSVSYIRLFQRVSYKTVVMATHR